MTEPALSKRARKKQGRTVQGQDSALSDSPISENLPAISTTPDLDADFKPREGVNPFIEVVQKKVRNLTKRRVYLPAEGT